MQAGRTEEEEEATQQEWTAVMARMMRQLKVKGRVDAQSSWCVSELLAADCKKACLRPEREGTMQQ